jgi:hypothetical protein
VPLAKNRTIEAGLEDMFTNELIQRLSADGRVLIVAPGEAEADLNCTLTELKIQPRAYNRAGMVSVERAQLTIECVLNAPQTESVIWKSGGLTQSEEYPLGNDYLANEDQKALALREVCRDLSESVRSLLLDSF